METMGVQLSASQPSDQTTNQQTNIVVPRKEIKLFGEGAGREYKISLHVQNYLIAQNIELWPNNGKSKKSLKVNKRNMKICHGQNRW